MNKNAKQVFIFFYIAISIWISAGLPGEVTLSNGQKYTGQISLNRRLSFQDLVQKKNVHILLSQVYRIETMIESTAPYENWQARENLTLARRFILSIHTWEGQTYWARLHLQVFVRLANQNRLTFVLPKTQFVSQGLNSANATQTKIVTQIQFFPPSPNCVPPTLLSLSGSISPPGIFCKVYALQEQYKIWLAGEVAQDGASYHIKSIMPGNYQLFFATNRELVFGLQEPLRANLMDKEIASDMPILDFWVKSQADTMYQAQMLYAIGRHSMAKILVMQQPLPNVISGKQKIELWLCKFHQNRWLVQCRYVLLEQPIVQRPVLLYDTRLENLIVPIHASGIQRWDYHADQK